MDSRTSAFINIMTLHAEEEMDDDELSIFDIERCVLTGKIIERQKDKVTNEWKYVIEGQSIFGDKVGTVAKLSLTKKLFIYISCMDRGDDHQIEAHKRKLKKKIRELIHNE